MSKTESSIADSPTAMNNERLQEGRKATKVRSSIACSRCRRSKIRCVNQGTVTVCSACKSANKPCEYATSAGQSSTPKRAEPGSGVRLENDGDTKRVRRKEPDSARKQSLREEPLGALENPPISQAMWVTIYDKFNLHFSTELPFVDDERLLAWAALPAEDRSDEVEDFLLGMLTLTARFIDELVHHHKAGDNTKKAFVASEFYAQALCARLSAPALGKASLERCQALLMLSLFKWGHGRGGEAWIYSGIAISMSEVLELNSEPDIKALFRNGVAVTEGDTLRVKQASNISSKTQSPDDQDSIKESNRIRETKRRIVYSIFIMDKYMSSGRGRVQRLPRERLRVQLPCSDRDFAFRNDVKTGYLMDDGIKFRDRRTLNDSDNLSIYIRLVDIWSRCSQWVCAGGRRQDKEKAPWNPVSTFAKLNRALDVFESELPSGWGYTPSNLRAHLTTKTTTPYTAIHTLNNLCRLILHSEYIPYVPLICDHPDGPIDAPTFPPEDVPKDFWLSSAETLFVSAKNIMDIVRVVNGRNSLPETPGIGFAIFQATHVGVYAIRFPFMDVGRYMCEPEDEKHKGATGLGFSLLNQLYGSIRLSKGWYHTAENELEHYRNAIEDFQESQLHGSSDNSIEKKAALVLGNMRDGLPNGGQPRSLRERLPTGGHLEEYKTVERILKDIGSLDDDMKFGDRHSPGREFSSTNTARNQVNFMHAKQDHRHGSEHHQGFTALNQGSTPMVNNGDSVHTGRNSYYSNPSNTLSPQNVSSTPMSMAESPLNHSNRSSTETYSPYAYQNSSMQMPAATSMMVPGYGSNPLLLAPQLQAFGAGNVGFSVPYAYDRNNGFGEQGNGGSFGYNGFPALPDNYHTYTQNDGHMGL